MMKINPLRYNDDIRLQRVITNHLKCLPISREEKISYSYFLDRKILYVLPADCNFPASFFFFFFNPTCSVLHIYPQFSCCKVFM